MLRASTLTVTNDQVVQFQVGRRTTSIGRVRLDWLDPHLKKQFQQDQVLVSEQLTAGFFQLEVIRDV